MCLACHVLSRPCSAEVDGMAYSAGNNKPNQQRVTCTGDEDRLEIPIARSSAINHDRL